MPDEEDNTGQLGPISPPPTLHDPGPSTDMTQDDPTVDGYSANSLLPDQSASGGLFGSKNTRPLRTSGPRFTDSPHQSIHDILDGCPSQVVTVVPRASQVAQQKGFIVRKVMGIILVLLFASIPVVTLILLVSTDSESNHDNMAHHHAHAPHFHFPEEHNPIEESEYTPAEYIPSEYIPSEHIPMVEIPLR